MVIFRPGLLVRDNKNDERLLEKVAVAITPGQECSCKIRREMADWCCWGMIGMFQVSVEQVAKAMVEWRPLTNDPVEEVDHAAIRNFRSLK